MVEKSKPGRKPVKPEHRRAKHVQVNLTEDEWSALKAAAFAESSADLVVRPGELARRIVIDWLKRRR